MPYTIQDAFLTKSEFQGDYSENIQDFSGTKGIIGLTPQTKSGTATATYTLGASDTYESYISYSYWPNGTDTLNDIINNIGYIFTGNIATFSRTSFTLNTTELAIGSVILPSIPNTQGGSNKVTFSDKKYAILDYTHDTTNGVGYGKVLELGYDKFGNRTITKIYDNSANPHIWNPVIITENVGGVSPVERVGTSTYASGSYTVTPNRTSERWYKYDSTSLENIILNVGRDPGLYGGGPQFGVDDIVLDTDQPAIGSKVVSGRDGGNPGDVSWVVIGAQPEDDGENNHWNLMPTVWKLVTNNRGIPVIDTIYDNSEVPYIWYPTVIRS